MNRDGLILVLDEGTTSTRAVLYAADGAVRGSASRAITQHYPEPGRVEHDAGEIWRETLACAREVVAGAGGAESIATIGIANQRETVVAWDRGSGEPLAPAIVWQDRRTAERCASLARAGHSELVQRRTGLRLDPYFCATKMAWLLDQPEVAAAGQRLALGTIDSWLAYKLTGAFVTDVTNACRTSLFALAGDVWDEELLALFGVSRRHLARIVPTACAIGICDPEWFGAPIPITAMAGDQQAATIGQGCLDLGQAKLTLGTGAFVLTNAGSAVPERPGNLLATILCDIGGERTFALEGSIFVAGSLIQWLRDNLGLIAAAGDSEALARSVADTGGVALLPALSGLGAPYWLPEAKAMITGLSFASSAAHVVRAALEATSHQCVDLAAEFAARGAAWRELRIDGGMSANGWLAQDLANMLGVRVTRPADVETTARGAAMLAAVGAGIHADVRATTCMLPSATDFAPEAGFSGREARLAQWHGMIDIARA